MSPTPTIAAAVDALRRGELVAFPTETVYGLGADARSSEAVARIYATKGRPSHNPLIVHLSDTSRVADYALLSKEASMLAARYWPGPLTLVLPRRPDSGLAEEVTAGLGTVGVRVPDHPIAHELLEAFDGPVAAPSANPSGRLSPTRGSHVREAFGDDVLVLEGGQSEAGLESTILDATVWPPVLLRAGTLLPRLEAELGSLPRGGSSDRPTSPGQLLRHYAPRTPLRLDATGCAADEAWLGFGPGPTPAAMAVRNLSDRGDLAEAAHNLFAMLHELDGVGARAVAVAVIPDRDEGVAIRDRLERAARGAAHSEQ